MAALQRVAADVAPLRSATRLNPAVGRLVDFWNGQERRICRYETNSCLINSLLICGIPSSVFAIAVDILAALTYQGCSYAHQSVSELSP